MGSQEIGSSYVDKVRKVILAEMTRLNITPYRLHVMSGVDNAGVWRFVSQTKPSWRTSFETVARMAIALEINLDQILKDDQTSESVTSCD